ncbi:MAG TPA: response regulator [Prolixibacteraceae bacterium]|nr:response regulator [Prolixibacteraceae bacterium]
MDIKLKKTILVAEDEDYNFELINELLSNTNLIVLRAINGVDAVEKCKTKQIDLVLMDIKMPEMDGYEATRQIRTFAPELPIVAQTAYALEKDIMRIMESGFNDYLSKPLNKNKMFAVINKYANQNEQPDFQ